MEGKCNKKTVIKIMGAYVAWVMGSGFATGQEILQFFTSYGYYSGNGEYGSMVQGDWMRYTDVTYNGKKYPR